MHSQIHSYFIFSLKNSSYIFCRIQKMHYICIRNQATRALSSAGSEHLVYTQRVGGSNPSAPTIKTETLPPTKGRLAQLVQSIWFTPRGSGVRIPQRPQKWKSCEEVREAFFISYRFYTNFLCPFGL